ncbi:MAG: Flap endonuclease 1 [Candidatus Thorarchaeota archaeon]|nr:MAG: Flap endonuclease 1 [Candidatus Thorarchaeota archaeon]
MGTSLSDIIKAENISLEELASKRIAIDAYNTLYQFLSSIRQPDGTPLKDKKGRVTSHLSGLFYRSLNLLEKGIFPIYVFDGTPPTLKSEEIERRKEIRESAREEWKKAKEEGRIEDARKAAQASSRLTSDMVEESKNLVTSLGIPAIQAPSEGEALAAQMTRSGDVWASASQDYDSLLYGCPQTVRNLSISGRRRISRTKSYKTISPEVIDLELNLRLLEITREELVDIAILVGTDYNDRVPGVGPKTALKLIKKHGSIDIIDAEGIKEIDFPYEEIRNIFLNPPKTDYDEPKWTEPDYERIKEILCTRHDFSENRVNSSLERLKEAQQELLDAASQSSLTDFF